MNTLGISERKEKSIEDSKLYFNAARGWRNIPQRDLGTIVLMLKIHTGGILRNNKILEKQPRVACSQHSLQAFQIKFQWACRVSILQKDIFQNSADRSALPFSVTWCRNVTLIRRAFSDIFLNIVLSLI